MREELISEFGCIGKVRFQGPNDIKIYDSEKKEIHPVCKECKAPASTCIIGANAEMWLCSKCALGG